ncbi:MAG: secretin and TonB N-terminal domain-containing protein [Bacteroides sp.]|nr:secretin and TonB N-terminal domain-containing protein [Bacteroides sp.]
MAILLLLILCMPLSAQVKEKLITMNFSKIPLSEAISRIEKVSTYTFFYDANQVDLQQRVSLSVQKATPKQAMDAMLKGTTVRYEVTNTQIAMYPVQQKTTTDKQITIKGQVIDNLGEPVIGANVIEAGTTNGVITNLDGDYTLTVNSGSNI